MSAVVPRRGSALHAARPTTAAAWCAAVAAVALALSHPLALAALLAATLAVAARVGATGSLRRVARFAVPMVVLLVVLQVLLDRHGLTVLARLGTLPVLGAVDVTLEALVAAGALALRLAIVLVVTAVAASTIDLDALLLVAHRRWPAGALTTALALRIAPVLVRDGRRMADARRCRPAGTPGAYDDPAARLLVMRAVTGSVLERASDLSSTLELRGHGLPRRARVRRWSVRARRSAFRPEGASPVGRGARVGPTSRPSGAARRSRHDLALLGTAVLLVAAGIVGLLTGAGRLATDPVLAGPSVPAAAGLAAALALLVLAPLTSRRGTGPGGGGRSAAAAHPLRPRPAARPVDLPPEARVARPVVRIATLPEAGVA